jgi:hypothetical protein
MEFIEFMGFVEFIEFVELRRQSRIGSRETVTSDG